MVMIDPPVKSVTAMRSGLPRARATPAVRIRQTQFASLGFGEKSAVVGRID